MAYFSHFFIFRLLILTLLLTFTDICDMIIFKIQRFLFFEKDKFNLRLRLFFEVILNGS